MSPRSRLPWIVAPALLSLIALASAVGQTEGTGGICIPVSERAGREFGCFIVATQAIGRLDSARAFWHLSTFPTRSAAEAANGPRGTVVESLGKVWLLAIAEGPRLEPEGPLQTLIVHHSGRLLRCPISV